MKNAKFDENFETGERCKGVHCVDLGESFPTTIYLKKFGFDTAENEPPKVWGGRVLSARHVGTAENERFEVAHGCLLLITCVP